MNNLRLNEAKSTPIMPLSASQQSQIRGGMAATDEDKRKKVKAR